METQAHSPSIAGLAADGASAIGGLLAGAALHAAALIPLLSRPAPDRREEE